jgi:formate hydrogenlyase transcriptional activator
MGSDLALLGLLDSENGRFHVNAFDLLDDAVLDEKAVVSLGEILSNRVLSTGKPCIGNGDDFAKINVQADAKPAVSGFKKSCVVPLVSRDQVLGVLALSKREDAAYAADEVDFLVQLSTQLAIAVENALVRGDLPETKNSLGEEGVYPENEIRSELKFVEIVGKSAALQRLLGQIEVVAPTDSGVLIEGETGTGKELIARAIHSLSPRRDRPFVKVNYSFRHARERALRAREGCLYGRYHAKSWPVRGRRQGDDLSGRSGRHSARIAAEIVAGIAGA